LQHPYLYEVASGKRVPLGHFPLGKEYAGEFRVDTHPRFSPDGRKVTIDSTHEGGGRQIYLIDLPAL
jgi:Tol biopolymer transport system component